MNKKIILTLIALVLLVGGISLYLKHDTLLVSGNKTTQCYIWNTEDGSKADIVLTRSGDKVTGQFDWLPAERDSKTGSFEGVISPKDANGNQLIDTELVTALWKGYAEGNAFAEELQIIIGNGIATPGFGQMKDRGDGVFVYINPNTIVYEPNLSLADDCGDKLVPPTQP